MPSKNSYVIDSAAKSCINRRVCIGASSSVVAVMIVAIVISSLVLSLSPAQIRAQTDVTPPIPLLDTDPGMVYTPPGRNLTSGRAQVRLDAFIELNCPDSVLAYPVLQEVAAYYSSSQLEVVFNQLPLPYHRNGFLCTQGLFLIEDQLPDQVFNYIQAVLDDYLRFSTSLTRGQSELQIIETLADVAVPATGIDRDYFVDNVNNFISPTVRSWKYGVRRGVAGTPWFFVNGIDLGVNPSITLNLDDWIAILDPLFQ